MLHLVVGLALGWWVAHRRYNQLLLDAQRAVLEAQQTSVEVTQLNVRLWETLDDNQRAMWNESQKRISKITASTHP